MKNLFLREWYTNRISFIMIFIGMPIIYLISSKNEFTFLYFTLFPMSQISIYGDLRNPDGMYLMSYPISRKDYLDYILCKTLGIMLYGFLTIVVFTLLLDTLNIGQYEIKNILFYSLLCFFIFIPIILLRFKMKVRYKMHGGYYFFLLVIELITLYFGIIYLTTNVFHVNYEFMNVLFDTRQVEIILVTIVVSLLLSYPLYKTLLKSYNQIEL
ncbi:ABC-2 family transporter [Breznakia blatticola]|uniref:ABC-2 family transporter n=1 Tax=Breznakia blatticola TaxID=1754012 RepID=A0A4R7ZBV2_9FIRM|nr:ABC-2 transporter permease [Breznakia blatticola]TDW14642.1 ABC-2 family transporter [Breznakia blatticola]